MDFKRILLLGAALFLLVAPTGCIFSPEDDNGGGGVTPKPELPFAGSQDQLMANLVTVYENMDYDGYLEVVDPDFKIMLQAQTVEDNGLSRDFFDYEQDINITRNMFSGDAPNEVTPGVTSIDFLTLNGVGPWENSQNPEFSGLQARTYDVHFVFHVGSGDDRKDLTVEGKIEFYLSAETVTHEGKERTQYRMAGQVDDTNEPTR